MEFKPSTIREGRKMKKAAADTVPGGRNARVFEEEIAPELSRIVTEGIEAYRDRLAAEWREILAGLGEDERISPAVALPSFRSALVKRAKLYLKTEKPASELAQDPAQIRKLCEQAAFDFIMILRSCAEGGYTLRNALKIAAQSHRLDPMDVKRLDAKYRDRVGRHVIVAAMTLHPRRPDAFIDDLLDEVSRLGGKYGDHVDISAIRYLAMNYPRSDKNPGNPDAAVDRYLGTLGRLREKYRDRAADNVVKRAALTHTKDPDAFIDWFLEAEAHLLSLSPRPKASEVHRVLLANTFSSKARLEKLI